MQKSCSPISKLVIFLLLASLLVSIFNVKFWKQEGQVIKWDVLEYYGYLPSAFIYNDLALKFTVDDPKYWGNRIWTLTAPNGNRVFKMSMGMSIMYAPFFGMAHVYASNSGHKADGYSAPYKFILLISSVFYLLMGLLFLRKILLFYFNDAITAFSIFAIVAGTNLWYYSSFEAPMSHVYSFSLITVFIWLTIKFYQSNCFKFSILIGFLFGLISLIRPSNAIILLFFVFYGIYQKKHLQNRIGFLLHNYKHVLIIILCSLLVWVPQMIYWQYITGQWFYFSYGENGAFYFSNPQIVNGLFSYRKGWFLYTPIMLLACLAIPLTRKYVRHFYFPLLIIIPINIYVIFSWWCWWYGGSFGQRPFIDTYALMALPLAAVFKWLCGQKIWLKLSGFTIIAFFIFMSIFYTAQYYYGAIHWDSMTKEAYWHSFGRLRPEPEFQQLIKAPDYEKALKGEPEY